MEAVRSPLMGIFEKRRAKKFFEFLQNWKDDDPATHQGKSAGYLSIDMDSHRHTILQELTLTKIP
jgi:Rab GDP dissociation inhibitor